MSLLFFDAMQECDTVVKPVWSSLFIATRTGRDGTANGASTPGSNSATGRRNLALPTPAATCIIGCGVHPGQVTNQAFSFYFMDASADQLYVQMNGSGLIEARKYSGNTLLATSSGHTPIGATDFPHVQVKVLLHSTAGSVEVLLNGVSVLSVSGVSTSTTNSSVYKVGFYSESGPDHAYFDDVWVCDTVDATTPQGQPNNNFLGDLKVAVLLPSGAGSQTQWTPSTGANYAAVDENPINTTDYVSDGTAGHQDLYALTDLPAGVTTIFGVQSRFVAQKSDSGSVQMKPLIRENSTTTADTAQGLGTTWGAITGAMKAVRPSDSALWTPTDVNAMQVGQEVA